MSGSVLCRLQCSAEDLQLLRAWYKIRDMLLGQNWFQQNIKRALELASVCEHSNAVWLANVFGGRDITSREEARQVFLGCENDPRALCFAALLVENFEEVRRPADLGDAFAQAWMAWKTVGEERFRWTEKSAAQGERNGFNQLGDCYQFGIGCEKDVGKAKGNFLVAAELGYIYAILSSGDLLDKDDPQRFVWFGRAAASNGGSFSFWNEMSDHVCNFSSGTGHAKVVFAIGRALRGHIDNEKRTIFGEGFNFEGHIGPANQALRFYEFQLQSYRKVVDSWTIVGQRNNVVRDIRKMIGKMVWDAREEAAYLETIGESKNMEVFEEVIV
jgi:hypothetical protein